MARRLPTRFLTASRWVSTQLSRHCGTFANLTTNTLTKNYNNNNREPSKKGHVLLNMGTFGTATRVHKDTLAIHYTNGLSTPGTSGASHKRGAYEPHAQPSNQAPAQLATKHKT